MERRLACRGQQFDVFGPTPSFAQNIKMRVKIFSLFIGRLTEMCKNQYKKFWFLAPRLTYYFFSHIFRRIPRIGGNPFQINGFSKKLIFLPMGKKKVLGAFSVCLAGAPK